MKNIFFFFLFLITFSSINAQMDVPPAGGNPRATVTESVGITDITLSYSRPDVNGREGKIWGPVVGTGFANFSFLTNRPTAPWRAGANENTTISFEHDVKLEGKPVPAGTYGLTMAVWPDSVILILSKSHDAWGSFYYDEKNDLLRIVIKPQMNDKSVEWLKYEFIDFKEKACTIAMMWEKLVVPFKIDVDVDNIVLASLRNQVTSQKGFNGSNMLQASQYCLNKGINLEEALGWAQRAVTGFGGAKSYTSMRNLAIAYEKLNRLPEADSIMTEGLTLGNAAQHIAYGRSLIAQKRTDKALDMMNGAKKLFGDNQVTNTGLAYAYSAKGDFIKALEAANKALSMAPNDSAKKPVQDMISKLKDKKDIN
ncbi:MAG: DUF2911 domain-containing protein [Saprospiraceae bacterium]